MRHRSFLLVLALVSSWAFFGPAAQADEGKADAKAFIESLADRAISALTIETVPREERIELFRDLLNDHFAVKTIGRWVLGRYWNRATKEQRAEYLSLFEDLIIATYVDRFTAYSGEALTVTKIVPATGKDLLVNTSITRPKATQPVSVDWRVRQRDSGFKIVDVIVEGVSMGQTQRSEFASVIRRNGGTLEGLLAKLRADLNEDA
ncbi:MAG: ABC transporter substrate-binding protein [Rhodospirillales bacterium]|nr:ABC transporter substrate-binding protein [Rhodospirillales bacterium]